nr:MAG TPA: hypothetical protein [Bacteriophage sp.]
MAEIIRVQYLLSRMQPQNLIKNMGYLVEELEERLID